MSISSALNNAMSGLTASARMAEVASSNIANALTDGYGRREVALSASQIGGKGAGVQVDGIVRVTDRGLIGDRRRADADLSGRQRETNALIAISRDFGAVGDPASLAGRIAAFEQSLVAASADPASEQRLGNVVTRLVDVTTTLRSQSDTMRSQREGADQAIAKDVETLNGSLAQVEKLNADISRMRNAGQDPSGLIDARQTTIDKIAALVPIRELDRGYGQVALYTVAGAALLDGKAANIEFTPTPTITPDMTFQSGALSGLTINGQPASQQDGVGKLSGGSLAAAFELRDTTLVTLQTGLDDVARDLMQRFEGATADPTLPAGSPGLITDAGGAFDATNLVGLAGRLSVNAAVRPEQGGALWRLRDGINATAAGPVGDATQLNRTLTALRAPTATGTGQPSLSAAGRIAAFESKIGSMRVESEENLTFDTARWDTLRSAELATGVDTDQELQQLLRIEQAYAANARVMQTIDSMIQRLMEI